jgi:hypothetical protein
MVEHGAFSLITEIKPGMKPTLVDLLATIEEGRNNVNGLIPFKSFPGIHFARLVILNESIDTAGKTIPDQLVFSTNYDLPANHIDDLVKTAGRGLWQVFSYCNNFPTGAYDAALLKIWLQQNSRGSNVFYVGVGYRSVQQIHDESRLRGEIEKFVDANKTELQGKDAAAIRGNIISHISSREDLKNMLQPSGQASARWLIKHYGRFVLTVLISLVLIVILFPVIFIWIGIIFASELKDKPAATPVTKDHMRELTNRETGMVQAQFSALGNLKPGWIRLQTMVFLLKLTNFMAPYIFAKGRLSGIPTVHFARWLIINEGRQMLFLSNYDGNTESYLTDFINIAAKQLTLLFSHTVGYPKTYLMVFGGAKDASKFLDWAHHNQKITNVWYSANPNVNVKNIFNNSKIRDGLHGNMSEQKTKEWLSLI